ncbi:hypothetical protein T492DRAFT_471121 [Pavlovales sp. CCMP2436]|nr:hypothetical protein T492DRAFT_471121 [Pavlovales sp. CCMP2436]
MQECEVREAAEELAHRERGVLEVAPGREHLLQVRKRRPDLDATGRTRAQVWHVLVDGPEREIDVRVLARLRLERVHQQLARLGADAHVEACRHRGTRVGRKGVRRRAQGVRPETRRAHSSHGRNVSQLFHSDHSTRRTEAQRAGRGRGRALTLVELHNVRAVELNGHGPRADVIGGEEVELELQLVHTPLELADVVDDQLVDLHLDLLRRHERHRRLGAPPRAARARRAAAGAA